MTEKIGVSATSKYIRISPTKVQVIVDKIRGKTYREALQILKYLPQKAGAIVWQTLYSAVSNATHNFDLEKERLIITEAYVNQGPIVRRMQARARGKANKIEKKISHITICVAETKN
jgi:large subunit ribosomal protein L22